MKKILLLFVASFAIVLTVSILANPVSAASGDTFYKKDEIYDFNELHERAENGVTDAPEIDEIAEDSSSAVVTNVETEESENVSENIKSTTQKLQVSEDENGDLVTTYATTSFFDPSSTNTSDKTDPQRASDSDSGTKSGAIFYSTIYYNTLTKNGAKHYDMYRVTGNFKLRNSNYAVTERTLDVSQSGPSYIGKYSHVNHGMTKYPGYSYSYSVPSTWQPIYNPSGWAGAGIRMIGNITGDGSNIYRYVFTNSVFD
jgi:hypothetical protein